MQLLRTALIWVWLAAAGPTCCRSFTTGHQVQVRIPWDVGSVIKHVTGYVTGQDSGHPPKKKKERPHYEEYWPPYGYYDPAYYPPYYYSYPPYPPPTYPPPPTKPPTTKKPSEGTTKPPTETTTNPSTGTTIVTTPGAPVTTTVAPVQTTEPATTVTTTTEPATTVTTTTEGATEATTTNPPGRDLCKIYPRLPECRDTKSKKKQSSNVLQPNQKLSIKTEPHPVTSLCFYYPRLCMQPEEAQFVSLSDENGRPLLLISPADKKSVHSKGKS